MLLVVIDPSSLTVEEVLEEGVAAVIVSGAQLSVTVLSLLYGKRFG